MYLKSRVKRIEGALNINEIPQADRVQVIKGHNWEHPGLTEKRKADLMNKYGSLDKILFIVIKCFCEQCSEAHVSKTTD